MLNRLVCISHWILQLSVAAAVARTPTTCFYPEITRKDDSHDEKSLQIMKENRRETAQFVHENGKLKLVRSLSNAGGSIL